MAPLYHKEALTLKNILSWKTKNVAHRDNDVNFLPNNNGSMKAEILSTQKGTQTNTQTYTHTHTVYNKNS